MEPISADEAVGHIVESMDNEYGYWYDADNGVTWSVRRSFLNTIEQGVLEFVFTDDNHEETVQKFRLVKIE